MTKNEFNKLKDAAWNEAVAAMCSDLTSKDCCIEYDEYKDSSITEVWNAVVFDAVTAVYDVRGKFVGEDYNELHNLSQKLLDVTEGCTIQ